MRKFLGALALLLISPLSWAVSPYIYGDRLAVKNDLNAAMATGTVYPTITLRVVRPAGPVTQSLQLSNAVVTSISSGGSGGEDRLVENVSFAFSQVTITYTFVDGSGKAGSPESTTAGRRSIQAELRAPTSPSTQPTSQPRASYHRDLTHCPAKAESISPSGPDVRLDPAPAGFPGTRDTSVRFRPGNA